MKVYIVTGEPFPNGMAATSRIKCYAKALLSQNVDCEVLIVRKTESYTNPKNTLGKGVADGVPFKYILGTPVSNKNIFVRQIDARTYKIRTCLFLKKTLKKGDVILGYLGHQTRFVERLIKIAHNKNAYYCRDLCELPAGTGAETKEAIRQRKYILEHIFPKLDGIIAISDSLYNLAHQYVTKKCIVVKVPILVDFEHYAVDDKSSESQIPYIFHAGGLDEQQNGILGMIEAFGKAVKSLNKQVSFIITGKKERSPFASQINELIEEYQLEDRIIFTGYLKENQLKEYLSKASLVIINKYRTQQNQYCFSTKLGEYMAAGKPVITTNVGESMNWLVNGESAYIVETENTKLLSEAIVEAFLDDKKRREIGLNGRKLCKYAFDYHSWGQTLASMMFEMGKNNC